MWFHQDRGRVLSRPGTVGFRLDLLRLRQARRGFLHDVVYNKNKMNERLQKILAHAGIASRRKAEEMIAQGRVSVNGHIVSELGSKADPEEDVIKVDGKRIRLSSRHIYILLNKPKNVMSTSSDPEGRPTVVQYVKDRVKQRVYPVGRLDFASEGLIILTNDGEFTKFMTKAAIVPKVYRVKVAGAPDARD